MSAQREENSKDRETHTQKRKMLDKMLMENLYCLLVICLQGLKTSIFKTILQT